jgi:hypothetical protein
MKAWWKVTLLWTVLSAVPVYGETWSLGYDHWLAHWQQSDERPDQSAGVISRYLINELPVKSTYVDYTDTVGRTVRLIHQRSQGPWQSGFQQSNSLQQKMTLLQFLLPANNWLFKLETEEGDTQGTYWGYDSHTLNAGRVTFTAEYRHTQVSLGSKYWPNLWLELSNRRSQGPQAVYVMADKYTEVSRFIDPDCRWNSRSVGLSYTWQSALEKPNVGAQWFVKMAYSQGIADLMSHSLSDKSGTSYVVSGDSVEKSVNMGVRWLLSKHSGTRLDLGYRWETSEKHSGQRNDVHIYGHSRTTMAGLYGKIVWRFGLQAVKP